MALIAALMTLSRLWCDAGGYRNTSALVEANNLVQLGENRVFEMWSIGSVSHRWDHDFVAVSSCRMRM